MTGTHQAKHGTSDAAGRLNARAIEVRYGRVVAVKGISLDVSGGELIAVTGPSGAGKTTLLSTLAGILRPSSGEVQVAGTLIRDRDEAVRHGIVLIPETNALVQIFTAAENVAVVLGRDGRVRERAVEALQLVGLEDAADQLVEELSGGQQQRVAVARALAQQGRFVLADEPTSELDSVNRDRVMKLLRGEAARGAGVLVATHDPEAAAVCDAELRLDGGVAEWIRY